MHSVKFLATRSAKFIPLSTCAFVALSVSIAYSCYHLPFVTDDALISYRYSDRLLDGLGLTWNDGEFVEGYSNLLWVLLIAIGGLFEPNLIRVGWIFGLLANVVVLIAIAWAFGVKPHGSLISAASGLMMLSLSGAFAFWAIAGLETALFGALLACALASAHHMGTINWSPLCPALSLGLLSITRPDGILFGVSFAIALALRDGFNRATLRRVTSILSFALLFFALQLLFRYWYYGELVPNTAHAKLSFTVDRVLLGGLYLAKGALVNSVPLIVIAVSATVLWRLKRHQVLCQSLIFLVPGFVWLTYVAIIGGDFFPYQRHWMPALVCFAFAVSSLIGGFPNFTYKHYLPVATVLAVFYLVFQNIVAPGELEFGQKLRVETAFSNIKKAIDPYATSGTLDRLKDEYQKCVAYGQFLRTAFKDQRPLVAVYHGGCLPYMTKFPSLDMLGLTDSYLAHHPPPSMGKGAIGHELGDGAYVLSRSPDLIEHSECQSSEGLCRIQGEMTGAPQFRKMYRLVFYDTRTGSMPLWTRIEGGRIGIARTAHTIYIPGFLLATMPDSRAALDAGRLVTEVKRGGAGIDDVYLPAGTWEISLITDADSALQLVKPITAEDSAIQQTVVSRGELRSFRVSGDRGKILAITAKSLD